MPETRPRLTEPYDYQHKAVRDLAWSLTSPDLLQPLKPSFKLPNFATKSHSLQHWLQALEQAPAPLEQFLAQTPRRRLGFYFEDLWAFFLTHYPERNWQLLDRNLQIADDNKCTLGELDFIVLQNGRLKHLELAVKYYLYNPQTNLWLGPNCRDRLDLKAEQIAQKQLQLCEQQATRQRLLALFQERHTALAAIPPIDKIQLIKGWLFYPSDGEHPKQQCPTLNPHHSRGRWLKFKHFSAPAGSRWQILEKSQWLAQQIEANPLTSEEAQQQLKLHFKASRQPLLLAAMKPCARSPGWIESERIFITADNWPQLR